jgi:hypothetical protein
MMSEDSETSPAQVRLLWAGAFVSGLVVTDLLMKLFCSGWPVVIYFVLGGVGAWTGPRLHRRFSGSKIVYRGVRSLSLLSAAGMVVLFVMPVNWDTKCAWRHCDRALGVGLFKSPFPVGTPTCRGWSTCVNEYPLSDAEYRRALRHIRRQGCPEP